jgi:hypothetical protein
MTWATTRTTSPPAWRELLNTQRRQRHGYGCVMDQDVEVRLGQEAKHHAVQAELIAVRAQHEDLMHERDILAAEVAVQEKIFTSII